VLRHDLIIEKLLYLIKFIKPELNKAFYKNKTEFNLKNTKTLKDNHR